jgi:hypothetical protein
MSCIDYKDELQLISTITDKYGAQNILSISTIPCLILSNTGFSHGGFEDNIISDLQVYIDPENTVVKSKAYRLEEELVIVSRFGSLQEDSWYKIIDVSVNEDKLLCNKVDNVLLSLKKTVGINYVS